MARSNARSAVMQMAYERISGGEGGEETLQLIYEELREEGQKAGFVVADNEPEADDVAYITKVLNGVLDHLDELDEEIAAASIGWSLERMPRVDLTILRLATWEILHEEDVPGSVAINEAVELANRYSDPDKSGRFINGVLGTILRKHEAKA